MSILNLNYDNKYDILYARLANYSASYGDEIDGIVTFYSIETDKVTGMAIYNAEKRIRCGEIVDKNLPIPINLNAEVIQTLLYNPEKGFKCTMVLS